MNIYSNEPTTKLLTLLIEMVADKQMLLANGFDKIAEQDDFVIANIMSELDSRKLQVA